MCPRGYHWGAISAKKSDFVSILHSLLRHIRGKVGDDCVRFVKFDGGAEFRTESVVHVYREWKLDFSVNCPTHYWQTGPVERGRSIHQNSMHTTGSFSDTPSVLWGQKYLLSVEIHSNKLHAGAAVCPYLIQLAWLLTLNSFISGAGWLLCIIILSIPTNFILAVCHAFMLVMVILRMFTVLNFLILLLDSSCSQPT